jgi:glycosyltransferase involved in cell wall biosynthesis
LNYLKLQIMKVILSHPTGNSFVRAAATGLLNADMLAAFNTTVAAFPGNIFDRLGGFTPLSELRRRSYDVSLAPLTHGWPWYELGRFAATKAGLNNLTSHETGIFSIDGVYRNLDKRVAADLRTKFKGADAIYAYEDGALSSFQAAKQLGMQCLYDLPIGYWRTARKLLDAERDRWPDWAPTLTGFGDSEAKLANKDEELRLADRIFVASSFTASTLNDFPGKLASVEVIPYAFPKVTETRSYQSIKGRPLKLLFVGGLSQRKGIADLFAAADAFGKNVELTIVGLKASDNCPVLDEALTKHTWIPSLSHTEILRVMREHDVLVFPSLFEGFGLVITEAMSQGTPVITTDRTAGPDLINDGENGWLFNAGSTEALKLAIENILLNPALIAQAGRSAMDLARKRSWDVYGQELAQAILISK